MKEEYTRKTCESEVEVEMAERVDEKSKVAGELKMKTVKMFL